MKMSLMSNTFFIKVKKLNDLAKLPTVGSKYAAGYDILTIHYAYVGANASNQKSEKDIVLVAKNGGTVNLETIKTTIETFVNA